jgi:hypothetical protein
MWPGVVLERNPPGIAERDQGCIASMTSAPIDRNNFFVFLMLGVLLAAMPTSVESESGVKGD